MFALWRAAIRRSRADWPFALASWLLLLCATTLLAAGAVYGDAVAIRGLHGAVLAAPPADRIVRVQVSVAPADQPVADATIASALKAAFAPAGGEVAAVIRTDSLALGADAAAAIAGDPGTAADGNGAAANGAASTSAAAAAAETRVLLVASHEGIERHARIVDGRWAVAGMDPVEATLSEGGARSLGLAVGDVITVAARPPGGGSFGVRVVGTWAPDAIDDGYWAGSAVETDGLETSGSYTYLGPLELPSADLLARSGLANLGFEWRGLPNVGALTPDNAGLVRANLLTLDGRLRTGLPSSAPLVKTDLLNVLSNAADATLVGRSSVLLLTLQFAIVAAYAMLLVAILMDERRRLDAALLRSRGATRTNVTALAAGEALVLALPAVALAPFLAAGLVWALSAWGVLAGLGPAAGVVPLAGGATAMSLAAATNAATTATTATNAMPPAIPPLAFVLSAAAGVACVAGFALPAALSGFSLSTVRSTLGRPLARTLAHRVGLDLALLVVAALTLWELRSSGSAVAGSSGRHLALDPMLVAMPAIGLLAGAVLVNRLVPRLGEVAERLLPRRRGLISSLLGRDVARQAHRLSRTVLLLVLASALGTFAATYGATWTKSQLEQAAFRSPLDVRATASGHATLPDWGAGSAYRALPGVAGALSVGRDRLDVGAAVRDGELLALDAEAAITTLDPARNPSARLGAPVPALLDPLRSGRPATQAVPLPETARRLRVRLDADLSVNLLNPPGPGMPIPRQAVDVTAIVADADGLHRIPLGTAAPAGAGQAIVAPLAGSIAGVADGVAPHAKLEAIEFSISVSAPAEVTGTLTFVDLAWSAADDGPTWTSLSVGGAGWSWGEIVDQSVAAVEEGAGTPAGAPSGSPAQRRVQLERTDRAAQNQLADEKPVVFRMWAPPAAASPAIPAVTSDAFLAASGAAPGDVVSATVGGFPLSFSIVGRVPSFATVDPSTPLVLVDGPTLALARYATWGIVRSPAEWWLSVTGEPGSVARRLATDPFNAETVVDRASLEASMRNDPVAAGIVGALTLGGAATLLMALVGFIVAATAMLRDRRPELAVLRALGISRSTAAWWLTVEQAGLVALSLGAGWLLGNLLAWLVLPAAAFSTTGTPPIPPPAMVVPVTGAASLVVFGALLVVVAAVAARRLVDAIAVAPTLRDVGR